MLNIVKRHGKSYYRTNVVENYNRYTKEDKTGILEQAILDMPITKAFMVYVKNTPRNTFYQKDVVRFLEKTTDLSYTTCVRRASTLVTWFCDCGIAIKHNGRYSLKQSEGQTTLLQF